MLGLVVTHALKGSAQVEEILQLGALRDLHQALGQAQGLGWLRGKARRQRLRARQQLIGLDHLEHDAHAVAGASHGSLFALIRDPKIFTLAFTYALFLGATYAMVFWVPTLVKSWGVADVFLVGVLTAIPSLIAMVTMVLIGRSSDKHNERRLHFFLCTVLGLAGTTIVAWSHGNLLVSLVGLAILFMGQSSATPIFFTAVSEYLPKKTAAGGIALVSSLGNLGPAVMPWITTRITTVTGSQTASLYLVGAMWITAGILLMIVMRAATVGQPRPAMA